LASTFVQQQQTLKKNGFIRLNLLLIFSHKAEEEEEEKKISTSYYPFKIDKTII
jgi:hypothetical protein